MSMQSGTMDPFDPTTGSFGGGFGVNSSNGYAPASASNGWGNQTSQQATDYSQLFGALGPIGTLFGSFMNASADATQAAMTQRNADLGLENAQLTMNNFALKAQQAGGVQASAYANSGVTLAGTPAMVMQQTATLAQQQLRQMSLGAAQNYQMGAMQAQQDQVKASSSILGGFAKAGTQVATMSMGGM